MLKRKLKSPSVRSIQTSETDLTPLRPEYIIISPIQDLESEVLKLIRQTVIQIFGYPGEVKSLLENLDFALDSERNQYYSTAILEKLAAVAPPQAVKVIAITNVDLFIPILTHVYGEAQLGGTACIISTYRLREGIRPSLLQTFRQRIVKESIHELGHTFNLRHCKDRNCIMHYCRSIRDVDQKSDQFCRYCKVLLADEMHRLKKITETLDKTGQVASGCRDNGSIET